LQNYISDYMQTTLVPQILDSWTINNIYKKAESDDAARKTLAFLNHTQTYMQAHSLISSEP